MSARRQYSRTIRSSSQSVRLVRSRLVPCNPVPLPVTRPQLPQHGLGTALLAALHTHLVLARHQLVRLLQATQLAQHLGVRLQVALDTEPRVQRLQARLVARPPPLQEVLLVPLRAPHAQPGLLTWIRLRPLRRRSCRQAGLRCAQPPDLQLMPPGALPLRVRGTLRGRPPRPLHRDPVQALLAQPSQVLRAHDAAVEDHRRALPGQRAQPPDRFLQRAGLADVARQHFRPPRKALPVQQQAERDQRAVMALLLGAAARRVGVLGPAGMEGVGEVVEDDAGLEAEQLAFVGEEGRLDLVAGLPEGVGGEIEGVGGTARLTGEGQGVRVSRSKG